MNQPSDTEPQLVEELSKILSQLSASGGATSAEAPSPGLQKTTVRPAAQSSQNGSAEDVESFLQQAVEVLREFNRPACRGTVAKAVEKLGIAAREYETHELMRRAGVLQLALDIISTLEPYSELANGSDARIDWLSLRFDTWRLLANISADDDPSRELIVRSSSVKTLIHEFGKDAIMFASNDTVDSEHSLQGRCRDASSTLLYNLLCYETDRQWYQQNQLVDELNGILQFHTARRHADPQSGGSLPSMFWDLLEEITTDWDIEKSPRDLPENILEIMLYEQELENGEEIFKFVASHLGSRTFSSRWASSQTCLRLLLLYFYNLHGESRLPPSLLQVWKYSALKPLKQPQTQRTELETACLAAIADLIEQPEFVSSFDLSSRPDVTQIIDLLAWPDDGHQNRNEDLIECACMILGNYASSRKTCMDLIGSTKLIPNLMNVLQYTEQYSTRYMATKLLKNLAVPEENKAILGNGGLVFRYLEGGLKESVRGELLQASISTARVLITPANAVYVISGSDAETPASSVDSENSFLESMLSLVEQVDEQSIKAEAGRLLKRLLQCVYKECDASERTSLEARLAKSVDLFGASLAAMVLQKQNAIVRSEGWLSLALLTRTSQGANRTGALLAQGPVYKAMQDALALQQQDRVEEQEQDAVRATDQQQIHDRENVRLMLKGLASHNVTLRVDGQEVRPEDVLSLSLR